MIKYNTVLRDGEGELIIEKSKFIGYAREVHSRADADNFFDEIRKKHKDASHNVPAFVIGDKMELKWASDDGEPQGTSGPPILKLLENEGLTNVAVIVTRYFGGTKLGTGGLARAYTASAKEAIQSAGYASVIEAVTVKCEIAYTYYDKLKSVLLGSGFEISDVEYAENITLTASAESEKEPELLSLISATTNGSGKTLNSTNNDIKIEYKKGYSDK